MKISESVENLTAGYKAYYNVDLAFVVISSEIFNPICKAYRQGELTLKQACTLLNSKIR